MGRGEPKGLGSGTPCAPLPWWLGRTAHAPLCTVYPCLWTAHSQILLLLWVIQSPLPNKEFTLSNDIPQVCP